MGLRFIIYINTYILFSCLGKQFIPVIEFKTFTSGGGFLGMGMDLAVFT